MADQEDYYSILGVSKTATQDEINKAYREKAKEWHPDRNHAPNATEMFEKITKAYEVLKDPQKRAAYDRFGAGAVDDSAGAAGFNASNFNGFSGAGFDGSGFEDIFSQFFGGGARASRSQSRGPVKGRDVLMGFKIGFMDACKGASIDMPYTYDAVCPACSGKGAVNSSDVTNCPSCHGTGRVVTSQRTVFGTFQSQTTCSRCGGSGTIIKNPCYRCNGSGHVSQKETLHIKVPAGIKEGDRLRVEGRGEAGTLGGPNGDLFLKIMITPDKTFTREDNDIHVNVDVPLVDAVLGGRVDVPTLNGTQTIDIKPGSQPGDTFRMKTQGIHSYTGRYGDEIVHFNIKIPTRLNDEEKDLYARLGEIAKEKGESKGFFSKIFGKKK